MAAAFVAISSNGGAGSTISVSHTPGAVNRLLVAFSCLLGGNYPNPSVTDNHAGGSSPGWYRIASAYFGLTSGTFGTLACFVRILPNDATNAYSMFFSQLGGSPTVTAVYASVVEISGMTRTGAEAIRQAAYTIYQSANTPAPAFSAVALTGNLTFAALGVNSSAPGVTPPTSWTEAVDAGSNSAGLEIGYRASGFTGTTVTWGSSVTPDFASAIVELDTTQGVRSLAASPTLADVTAVGTAQAKIHADVAKTLDNVTLQAVTLKKLFAVASPTLANVTLTNGRLANHISLDGLAPLEGVIMTAEILRRNDYAYPAQSDLLGDQPALGESDLSVF